MQMNVYISAASYRYEGTQRPVAAFCVVADKIQVLFMLAVVRSDGVVYSGCRFAVMCRVVCGSFGNRGSEVCG